MRGGVEEVVGEGDEGLVAYFLSERVDTHGADEFFVLDAFAVLEGYDLGISVDAFHGAVGTKSRLFFGQGVCYCDPDVPSATGCWEAECSIGTPVASGLL